MPRGDYTGPWGRGPMTGRGAGYCAGYPVPGFANPIGGRGFGRAFGRGWGRGMGRGGSYQRGFYGGPTIGWASAYPRPVGFDEADPQAEAAMLRETANVLEAELKEVKKRLAELENEKCED
ncbi:MAG: DUF5320 domain-containing protein [Firmicutes bacterium]|mgnify:CR=1 FL=1|nr:DUF5320 domain-containing protein [Bacillota bacterium]